MSDDPELIAMGEVYKALKDLDEAARARVISWVTNRFSLSPARKPLANLPLQEMAHDSSEVKKLKDFESVAECFALAKPKSTANRALVVAAYLQETKGGNDISGREINKELTHMGYGVGNITRAVAPLISAKPQLLIQTRKEGKTKQAQKKYRVTNEGFAELSKWLAGSSSEE